MKNFGSLLLLGGLRGYGRTRLKSLEFKAGRLPDSRVPDYSNAFGHILGKKNSVLLDQTEAQKLLGDDVDQELTKKRARELLKEDDESRRKAIIAARKLQDGFKANIDEVENENIAALGRRAMILLFGFDLDILDWVVKVLDTFGLEKFEEGVKAVFHNDKVMGAMADVNRALHVDNLAKELSRIPVLNDFNQFVIDVAKSDLVSPFTSLAGESLKSDPADLAIRMAVFFFVIDKEFDFYKNATQKVEVGEKKFKELESEIKKMGEGRLKKFACSIIELETETNLKRIDFKVLQNIRSDPSKTIDDEFKKDLQGFDLFYKDKCGNQTKVSAFNLLNDTVQYNDAQYLEIMRFQNNDNLEKLTEIVTKNSDTLTDQLKLEHQKSRENLLLKSIEKLDLQDIRNVLSGLGGRAKQIGDSIIGDEEKQDVVNQIMKLSRGEGDAVIKKLAIQDANVDIMSAEIKAHKPKSVVKQEEKASTEVPPPSSFAGGTPSASPKLRENGGVGEGLVPKESRLTGAH